MVYIDDIIIFSETFDQHLEALSAVFDRLTEAGICLNAEKCSFCRKETLFLGHIVSKTGVRPNPAKVAAVQQLRLPQNVKQVRAFLGMSGYYCRFIPDYATVAAPLVKLLARGVLFDWGRDQEEAFQMIKKLLVHPPILTYRKAGCQK